MEKDKKQVEWLYEGGKAMQEEFLTGRKITADVITCQSDLDKNAKCEVLVDRELLERRAQIDMQNKMREDPLFLIRSKEEEQRRRIMENPVKYKQLQRYVASTTGEQPTTSKSKRGEEGYEKPPTSRKDSKRKSSSSSESSSDSDSDDELLTRYLKILASKQAIKASSQSPPRKRKHAESQVNKETRRDDKHEESKKRKHEEKRPKQRDAAESRPAGRQGAASSTKGLSKEEVEAKLRKMTANAAQHATERLERSERRREDLRREADSLMRKAQQVTSTGDFHQQAHAAVARAQLNTISSLSDRLNRSHTLANRSRAAQSELDEKRFTDR